MEQTNADQQETYPAEEGHAGGLHGSTPAAWTAVLIVLVAFTVGAIAMVIGPNWLLFWIAVGIAVAGGLVGKVMQLLGFGVRRDDHAAH
jgi:fatty acid desaturase